MNKKIKKFASGLLIFSICTCVLANIVWANQRIETSVLSPRINLDSESLQKANQYLLNHNTTLLKQEKLPEWLNLEALEKIRNLKVIKTVTTHQSPSMDSDEGPEIFDRIKFRFFYQNKAGHDFNTGEITIWKYRKPEGVRLFVNKSNRYNLRVVSFTPDLPRGKSVRGTSGQLVKAGAGISMLWLLFAHEHSWHGQKALIFNAEIPSQKVFKNIKREWDNLIFSATPFYAEGLMMPPLVHIAFKTPELNSMQMDIVRDFFENKIIFVDNNDQRIKIRPLSGFSIDISNPVETSI